ncbi:hypothetical protein K435DRAFT_714825 [Dendrothele bispora CBS 962.96]|uniref:Protein kinase domain-containing protein n=1 Tax=Dendrothele bispora (strain CBS 962.96) TaxID=1314807 RepID=A0A4S8MMR5_DENBC|nr:hypothetical protein K435DRAFT_714825 [Dendrothele bispora CBS 962.96]
MTTNFNNRLKYYLFTNGNDPQVSHPLNTEAQTLLIDLSEQIKKDTNTPSDIALFKAEDLYVAPRNDIKQRVQAWLEQHIDEELDLSTFQMVEDIWSTGGDWSSPRKYDLVAVDSLALDDLKIVHALPDVSLRPRMTAISDHRSLLERFDSAPTPSAGSTNLKTTYAGKTSYICAGRPAHRHGPPNALFNRSLARLSHEIRYLDPAAISPTIIDIAHKLLEASAAFYDTQNSRKEVMKPVMEKLFPEGIWWQTYIGGKQAKPEAYWLLSLIFELKNQRGSHGDPTTRAVLDYIAILADKDLSAAFRTRSNAPSVSLGLAGSELIVSSMISTDAVYVEELYCEDLHGGFDIDERVIRVARVLQAVKNAFDGLNTFYAKLIEDDSSLPDGSHLLPRPVHANAPHLDLVDSLGLRFLYKLGSRKGGQVGTNANTERMRNMQHAVYVALGDGTHIPSEEVIVKFTLKYNVEAHQTLAKANLAPKLYHHCPVLGGYVMIVMEKVVGKMAWDWKNFDQRKMPRSIYADVHRAVDILHDKGIVFGDLRLPNILVRDISQRAVLVDFDWAAKEGEGRYPPTIDPDSLSHGWASGVERYGLMKKEHDLHMLEMLKGDCEES